MILTLKVSTYEVQPDGRLRIVTGCEDLREALNEHSPNILIDYLNDQYHTNIDQLKSARKEAKNGNV